MNKKRYVLVVAGISILLLASFFYFRYRSTHPCGSGIIRRIDSYNQVADMLKNIGTDTLVLFDVDDTLIIPADIAMRSKTKEEHQQWLKNTIDTIFKNAPHPISYYEGLADYSTHHSLLVEPIVADIITSLQNRGITVLALTAAWTGSFGSIPFFPQFRLEQLQKLGIDFSKAHIPDAIFKQLPEREGTYPMLYQGMLCANLQDKGLVLGAFLDYMKWKPSHIIFFEDSYKRVKQVVEEMCKRNIPCTGYQYFGFEHVPGELDKELTIFQFKYLLDHERWLNDEDGQKLLKRQNENKRLIHRLAH